MPLDWKDLFFEEKAQLVLDLFELTPEERELAQERWSEEMFEVDRHVFRGDEGHIIDGRKSALLSLQTICEKLVLERSGVTDRRAEMRKRLITNGNSDRIG